ncbi:hypothetical protein [Vibrio cholerae]|uniref:hypothetical protein n=1 Tax=Vibrio cholerae TaxID=666 RepID=UPI00301CE7F5
MKNKITVITGNHLDFDERAKRIVQIYNEETKGFDESFFPTERDNLHLVYLEGIDGSVIVDKWGYIINNRYISFNIVLFAAFSKQNRNKGYLRNCIEGCGLEIQTVQVSPYDPIKTWHSLGFRKAGTIGMDILLRKQEIEGIHWGQCNLQED